MSQSAMWCKFIAALVICTAIACSEQILPQLVAQIASLDHDHGISLRITNNGLDLVLTHDTHALPAHDEVQCLALSAAEAAHTIHFAGGPARTKQSVARTLTPERQVAVYF